MQRQLTCENAEDKRETPARLAAAPHCTTRITALEAEAADLHAEKGIHRADLDAALGEAQRLATAACRHAAVDGGHAGRAGKTYGSRPARTAPGESRETATAPPGRNTAGR
jgi:hypothetical protein